MKIASSKCAEYRRNFRKPLITSQGIMAERIGSIISLFGPDRTCGFGETGRILSSSKSNEKVWGKQFVETMLQASRLSKLSRIPKSPAEAREMMGGIDEDVDPDIRFGMETALCDLSARMAQKPLCEWLGKKYRDEIPVNYLLSGPVDDWSKVKGQISTGGYRAVKLKVGSGSIEEDAAFVEKLRDTLGPNIVIRLDANRAWSFDEAVEILSRAKNFNIDYIEEPLDKYDPGRLKALRKVTGLKMALDESLAEISDIKNTLSNKICDVIVLKPAIVGGIIETIELFSLARNSGHQAVITSNLETEIGIAAQLHLAAALPGEIPPFGLDTIRLYEGADTQMSKVENGMIRLPDGDGIGIGDENWNGL